MNAITKSVNVTYFLRASTTAVSNGSSCIVTVNKGKKEKVTTIPSIAPKTSYTLAQNGYTGPIRISSGPAGWCKNFNNCNESIAIHFLLHNTTQYSKIM